MTTSQDQETIQFGVTPVQTGVDFNHIREVALKCEELGYDSLWLNDHFFTSAYFYPLPLPSASYYECWVTLSALASLTKRIRLGTLCTNVSFRNPALLAKMAACLDVISEGRLELALGVTTFIFYFTVNEFRSLTTFARYVTPAFREIAP